MTRAEYIKFAVEVLKSAPIIGMLDNAEFVKQMVKILPVLNQKAVNV